MSAEQSRINDNYSNKTPWLKWGPYLSERQWGTVREDYSGNGDAWNYITHDMARSKAYRWGEEGIGGWSDSKQILCLGLGLWNGKDAILKERLFGLTNGEGNHGEDVKELYYYLDSTPTHSYMKMLYKYTHDAYPYQWLIDENGKRGKLDPEFELIDTGMFDHNQYFDVFIEYAKITEDDILVKYTVCNRADQSAHIHVLPQLWFRNDLTLSEEPHKPELIYEGNNTIFVHHKGLGADYFCYADGEAGFLFTNNETNNQKLYNAHNASQYLKDGINNRVVNGDNNAVNPENEGTKAAIWYQFNIPPNSSAEARIRLTKNKHNDAFADFDAVFNARKNRS